LNKDPFHSSENKIEFAVDRQQHIEREAEEKGEMKKPEKPQID